MMGLKVVSRSFRRSDGGIDSEILRVMSQDAEEGDTIPLIRCGVSGEFASTLLVKIFRV